MHFQAATQNSHGLHVTCRELEKYEWKEPERQMARKNFPFLY